MKVKTVRTTLLEIAAGLWLLTGSVGASADETAPEDETSPTADAEGESPEVEGEEAFPDDADEPADGEDAAKKDEATPEGEEKWGGRKRDHKRQGFMSILGGTGYFMVAPYDKDDPDKRCADDKEEPEQGEPLCSGRSGWHLDMLAGYGLKPGFELFAIFRLGLEQPSGNGLRNQPKVRQVGAGIKIYTPKEGLFKLAFGVAPLFDFSNRGDIDLRPDFVIHVPIAAHFDIYPWFAAFAQVSPNISFISEFRLEFTGGIGLQGRFP